MRVKNSKKVPYLKGVVGPKALYDMELTGVEYTPTRIRQLWEKLLSKATLVADDDERGAYMTRRDAFTRKSGLMCQKVLEVSGDTPAMLLGLITLIADLFTEVSLC